MKKLIIVLLLLIIPCFLLADTGTYVLGVAGQPVASGDTSNDIYDAQVRFGATVYAANFKIVLLSDAGAVLAVSNSSAPTANSTVTVTFPSAYTLSSATYRLGIIADDGYLTVGTDGPAYAMLYNAANSYASPGAVAPGSDPEASASKLAIAIRNSSATVLLGSTAGSTSSFINTNQTIWYWETGEAYTP